MANIFKVQYYWEKIKIDNVRLFRPNERWKRFFFLQSTNEEEFFVMIDQSFDKPLSEFLFTLDNVKHIKGLCLVKKKNKPNNNNNNPLSLMELCRRATRRTVGLPRLRRLEELNLPRSITLYLQYYRDDEDNDNDIEGDYYCCCCYCCQKLVPYPFHH